MPASGREIKPETPGQVELRRLKKIEPFGTSSQKAFIELANSREAMKDL